MRVEIGSGQRPTPGFEPTDIYPHPGVRQCPAWELDYPDGTVSEVLALGVMEHLTFDQFDQTVTNVYRMLEPGGRFLFDVPDLRVWCRYLIDVTEGRTAPFTLDHILRTIYGWQRWPGDEHKSGWTHRAVKQALFGWGEVRFGVEKFTDRGYHRRRMSRPGDAHLYVEAIK